MSDMSEYGEKHRTTYGHFLNKGKWANEKLEKAHCESSYGYISEKAKSEGSVMYLSSDDTVNEHKKPSSKAKKPMAGCDWHYSHLKGKQVYGHQVQVFMASTGDVGVCCKTQLYDKTKSTKIENCVKMAESLEKSEVESYFLCDSWYTCSNVINAFKNKNYHTIGAVKTNRIIFPNDGLRISIADYAARFLTQADFHLVTVNKQEYWIYRYDGEVNGLGRNIILLSYPKDAFGIADALRAFLSTNTDLSDKIILFHYSKRWSIEVFFKQIKLYFGFASYQIRSVLGIIRFLLLAAVFHFFCVTGLRSIFKFGDGVRHLRHAIFH